MTRDEILKMEAGREMDALIAEYLHFIKKRPYSSDIAMALKVVEKLGCETDLAIQYYSGQTFGCSIYRNEKVFFALAPTAPLAICRACLIAALDV